MTVNAITAIAKNVTATLAQEILVPATNVNVQNVIAAELYPYNFSKSGR